MTAMTSSNPPLSATVLKNPLVATAALHEEEANLLRAIWDASADGRLGQAQFGERYGIGGQSAVANFLSGRSPLSLKAALGFARGLRVRVHDFSPRLAAEAIAIASALNELKEYESDRISGWQVAGSRLNNAALLGELWGVGLQGCRIEPQSDTLLTVQFWHPDNDLYALRVRGDAFYPRFRSGEFLILSATLPPLEGCEALVSTRSGKKFLRVWNGSIDGDVLLLPLTPAHAQMTFREEDIESTDRVLGCVPRDALRQPN